MGIETWQTLGNWALAVLVYPGALFGIVLALLGDWLFVSIRPSFSPGPRRAPGRRHMLTGPVYNFLKLLGRSDAPGLTPVGDRPGVRGSLVAQLLLVVAPILALALLPFPASPAQQAIGSVSDLLVIIVLLALGPVCMAVVRSYGGGPGRGTPGRRSGGW